MIRLRLSFLLLSIVMLVPTALIVDRALTTLAEEDTRRHQLLADRIFDEMERSLTELLKVEEARSFDVYRPLYFPDPDDTVATVSPLCADPDEDYVIAYFQVDPDGTVQSPMLPGDQEDIGQNIIPLRAPTVLESELAKWVRGTFQDSTSNSALLALAPEESPSQAPGTTYPLRSGKKSGPKEQNIKKSYTEKQAKPRDSGFASKLGQLNMGSSGRSTLPTKIDSSYGRTQRFTEPQQIAIEAPPNLPPQGKVEVQLDPMIGRLLSPERLILYRTVIIGEKGYRQGLLIDVSRLMTQLRDSVIQDLELGQFRGGIWRGVEALAPGDDEYVFRHRFAAPFTDLGGILTLTPLPPTSSELWLKGLAIALAIGASLGLIGLYRSVAVQVAFAQRRSDFVSAVSHELKTPITSIRMYAEMLQEGMVDNETRRHRYYGIITAEAERLSRLVGNVLELSRIERGGRKMSLTSGPVAPVLEDVCRVLSPHGASQGFALKCDIQEGLPLASFEEDGLRQILFNLVDNAFKYAAQTPTKQVRVFAQLDEKGRVEVGVRDHGPGVPKAQLKRILEPFFRGERELTRQAKGTGIGLALVKGLSEGMGAELRVRNHPDGGFEVGVHLQAEQSPALES